ncbi:MAG: aminomethyl-transferring glycine dehydrogenase subunit GcvPB, partial [Candidatus Eisenbacteria bacterium]|nr:aminomethyl-transferring glycine dehydrogenase subunit GcvPB [Candidatus Eisenbacteria bacterium]
TLDRLEHFAAAMETIAREAAENPEQLRLAPHTTPVSRLDEGRAARDLVLHWRATPRRPAAVSQSASSRS